MIAQKIFKDFLGQPVDVGDYIFYSTTGRYSESRLGKIVKLTDKSVIIDVVKANRPTYGDPNKNVRVQNDFVKVEFNG